jgi:ribosomal protein L37E
MATVEYLYVICDKCGKPTDTGILADPDLAGTAAFHNNHSTCSHCGHMILWSKTELWPESVIRTKFPEQLK